MKRVVAHAFRRQGRGGRGVTGHSMRGEDELTMLFPARSLDSILFFSDRGKVYSEKAYQIPESDRTDRGIQMASILALGSDETVTAAVAVPDFSAATYCTMVTRRGKIKRVALAEVAAVRPAAAGTTGTGTAAGRVASAHRGTAGRRGGSGGGYGRRAA